MPFTKIVGAGIQTTTDATVRNFQVTGVLTATSFSGDGSSLTGVSGFATVLSSDTTSPLNLIFKTPEILTIGAGTSVRVTSDATSGNTAFTRCGTIRVASGATFAISSGTTFIANVLRVF